MVSPKNDGRGRHAQSPTEIPSEGWKDIAARVKDEIADDNTSLAAAGVSFFGFLAVVPGLAAAVSIYAMFADPTEIQRQLSEWLGNLPEEAQALITDQLSRLAEQTSGALTWGAVVAVALALWTASNGKSHQGDQLGLRRRRPAQLPGQAWAGPAPFCGRDRAAGRHSFRRHRRVPLAERVDRLACRCRSGSGPGVDPGCCRFLFRPDGVVPGRPPPGQP